MNAEDSQEIALEGDDLKRLQSKLDVKIRILSKSNKKMNVHGFAYTYENFKNSLSEIFISAGLLLSSHKIFHGKGIIDKDSSIEKLYSSQSGLNFFACESRGKPSVWKRFSQTNNGGTWSNSGNSFDRMTFIPNKNIM